MKKRTSEDILQKTFSRKMFGGYNSKQVAEFLQTMAGEWEESEKTTLALNEKLQDKEARLKEYRERELVLKDTISTAQKMAVQIKQDAEKEAQFILESARQKAELIVQEARDSLKTAYQDLSDLKRIQIQLKNTLRAVLQSHQDLLEQDPAISLLPSSFQEDQGGGAGSMIEEKVSESLSKAVQSTQSL